jgi:hypothetical protein
MNPDITLNHMNESNFLVDACYFGKKNKTDENLINMGKLESIELGSLQQLNNEKADVLGNKMCANFEKYTQKLCNDDTKFMLSAPTSCPTTSLYQRGKEMINKLSCTGPNCISDVANGGKYRSRLHRKTKRSRKTRRHRKTKKSRKYRK